MKKNRRISKRFKFDLLKPVCWVAVPAVTVVLLVLDALGIYTFNDKRLTVLGICLIVVLLPFFSEIKIKDISVKRNKPKSEKNT